MVRSANTGEAHLDHTTADGTEESSALADAVVICTVLATALSRAQVDPACPWIESVWPSEAGGVLHYGSL